MPAQPVIVYTTAVCPYCMAAKRLLQQKGVPYQEIDLSQNGELRQRLSDANGGWRTVPMIFIGKEFIGGFQELSSLDKRGELDGKLRA